MTSTGNENLSAGLPRSSTDVEAWMAGIWADGSSRGDDGRAAG